MSTAPTIHGRFTAWLWEDDRPRWTFWLTDPRCELAYRVSDLGAAVSRLATRIHRDAPGDFWQGYRDGQQITATWAAVVRPTSTREDVRRLLHGVGLPADDAAIERLGWGESA